MNVIEKEKKGLIGLAIFLLVLAAVLLTVGIILVISGAKTSEASGIVKLIIGIILIVLNIPCFIAGLNYLFLGLSVKAKKGSIKMGNIAKEGGTVNMKKCDRCGTERKEGETVCSTCGKKFED